MKLENCPSYEGCDAPLCPLYEFKELSIWYPEEDICNKIGRPEWVRKQRRIKKKVKDRDSYYSIEMLEAIHSVTKATRGLDAEGKRTEDVFLRRRARPTPTTSMPVLAQNTPSNKAKEGYNPHDMPKSPYQPMLNLN